MLLNLSKDQIALAADFYGTDEHLSDYASVIGKTPESIKKADSASDVYNRMIDRKNQLRAIFDNNGFDAVSGKYITLIDAVSQYDGSILLPQVIEEQIIEAIEPNLQLSNAFSEISGDNADTVMQMFPAVGAIEATEIAYGQEYPEANIVMAGGVVYQNIAKYGVSIGFEEETIADSRFDLIALSLRAMGAAMARKKEEDCRDALLTFGQIFFDNDAPANGISGTRTSGLDKTGAQNGTITAKDLLTMWGHSASQGYPIDTLFVHPQQWTLFLNDPVTRIMAINGLNQFFGQWTGSQAGNLPSFGNGLGVPGGINLGNITPGTQFSPLATSAPVLPERFPIPLSIVPSVNIPYEPTSKKTDIIGVSSGNVGAIIVKEPLSTGEWQVPSRDIRKIKVSERRGIGIANAGIGIVTARNIVVDIDSFYLSSELEATRV